MVVYVYEIEYLRLTLISYGWNSYDYGLTVTTPGSSIRNLRSIGAYGGYDPMTKNNVVTDDPLATGRYVDEDFL